MNKNLIVAAIFAFCAPSYAEEANNDKKVDDAQNSCRVTIEANDSMQYNIKSFTINKEKCPQFTIELRNVGKMPLAAMGHNVVITTIADMPQVASDGILAGLKNSYVKVDDERVITYTKHIGGGETLVHTFNTDAFSVDDAAKNGEKYGYFCSFPGHYAAMQGKIIFE